jgi:hypothetical protein
MKLRKQVYESGFLNRVVVAMAFHLLRCSFGPFNIEHNGTTRSARFHHLPTTNLCSVDAFASSSA